LLTWNNKVTIAIIDDWVYMNHPDISSNMWINWKESDGNWIDDDNNGFIDDYNWRNFVTNSKDLTPTWEHGTMVAWIIGAISNNSEWIAWIIPNNKVNLMPLIVFDKNWNANHDTVIKAINYAIDNWANIINLSLWWYQFQYTDKFDSVFKKAYDNNVVIVVAAWNGDDLTKAWINTSITKLSPACNGNKNGEYSRITVAALNKDWKPASWTNDWFCRDIYAFWEWIYTTTISSSEPYTEVDWTSFSAPMISAIIWLWYIKYWKINPNIIYYALANTYDLHKNKYFPDAHLYLDNLQDKIWELSNAVKWMYDNNLTKFANPEDFMASRWLRRDEAAKFYVQYAKQVMWKTPDYSKQWCNFKDLNEAWSDLKDIIVESCQLWLFQWNNWKFMPTQQLTNAQALTVFMRLREWYKDETGSHFANNYYESAHSQWLLYDTPLDNRENFDRYTTRWDVAKMLFRCQKQ
jgi:hypothetical protein